MFQYYVVLIWQNVSILYTTDTHFDNSSVKIGPITFSSSSDKQRFHHLLGCHVIGINSSLPIFLSALRFSNLMHWTKSCLDYTEN